MLISDINKTFQDTAKIDDKQACVSVTRVFLRGVMGLNFKLVKNGFKLVTGSKKFKF